jgi:hypothetical protein
MAVRALCLAGLCGAAVVSAFLAPAPQRTWGRGRSLCMSADEVLPPSPLVPGFEVRRYGAGVSCH